MLFDQSSACGCHVRFRTSAELLVGAGMLLLSLLVMLRAAERRAEMGMSRALGLQRTHLVQLLLFEGCACGIFAALLGTLAGIGVTALEIAMLSHLPALDASINGSTVPGSVFGPEQLEVWVSRQSLLSACCIGVLTTLLIVLLTALWISRTTIATAMLDLDDPAPVLPSSRSCCARCGARRSIALAARSPKRPQDDFRARLRRWSAWYGDSGHEVRCV
jgi:hypothetical protein